MIIFRTLLILILLDLNTTVTSQDSGIWMAEYDFVFLDEFLENAQYDIRYFGNNNFVGRPIKGYKVARLVLTRQAADTLREVEKFISKRGYGLRIFDTYRPQRAVDDFIEWSKLPFDTLTKAHFYPNQEKSQLFNLGYIASKSGHSRGSTIDLTLYHLDSGIEVDMGGAYDFFGERSHHGFQHITRQQQEGRKLLKDTMWRFGFKSYSKEWWHYTLYNEPYPNTYFDFIIH